MEVTQAAPSGKSDVSIRLTAEEASIVRDFLSVYLPAVASNALRDLGYDQSQIRVADKLLDGILNQLDDLGY